MSNMLLQRPACRTLRFRASSALALSFRSNSEIFMSWERRQKTYPSGLKKGPTRVTIRDV